MPEGTQANGAEPDPDAPLITWHWQRPRHHGQRRERTVTSDVDLVAPSSVDRCAHDYVRVGQSYVRAFAAIALPRHLRPGALAHVARLPGIHLALVNNPVPRPLAKERLAQQARAMGISVSQTAEADADESLAYRDLRRHILALAEERTAHHLFGLYLTVAGADLVQLDARTRELLDACTNAQLQIRRCDFQHWEGVLTTAPLGHDQLRYLTETDTPTLARLLPSSPATLHSGAGVPILYGLRAEGAGQAAEAGAPILLDRFALPSPHEAVIAATGGGKSYQMCWRLVQRFAHGNCAICVIDPKDQEYRALIEQVLGGTYVVLSEHASTRLNPLMLPWGDPAIVARLRRLDLDIRASRAALVKQIVASEAQIRGMPLSGRAEVQLEEAIIACYEARGISHDLATFHADVPTLSDVTAHLAMCDGDTALLEHLALFTHGSLGRLINTPGTLPLSVPPSRLRSDVGVLGIDLSAFIQGNDQTLKRVLPVLIANYVITVAMSGSGQPMELIIDEAWTLLASEAGASVLETIARIGRSLKVGATVITQQVREFLYRRAGDTLLPNEAGKTFLDNCETILLLRQLRPARAGSTTDNNPIVMAAKHFGLAPGEMSWLSQCRRDGDGATGLLLVGREPIPLRIPRVPEPVHSMLTLRVGGRVLMEDTDAEQI
jgi:hypothetical protein